ncbi:hypothetical protein DFH06DRAFT_942933, partial [Mycena polygramma]
CPGIPIDWGTEVFWSTYPFQLHAPGTAGRPKYDLILSEYPKARSTECLGGVVTPEGLFPCSKCSALTLDVAIIRERASRSHEQIRRHNDLNSDQLHAKLADKQSQIRDLQHKNSTLTVSLGRARERVSEWKETFHFIGQNSIPALHRLLANAEKDGWSAPKILEQCRLAKDGKYTARNYTQYEIDLTILIYELGGGSAVYALNHSIFALPSRNTIQPFRRQHKLVPSVNGVRFGDISKNIATLFGTHPRRDVDSDAVVEAPMICGHTLSFDELATERKIDYMTETDEMGGFCIEHLSALETVKVGADTHAVEAAVSAVKEGRVHISHETSVGAISRLSETGYGAKPVFMGPTCKKGSWKEMLSTMETVVEAWKRSPDSDGQPKHGPVLSVSTDGDHKRRLALFVMCMQQEIVEGNPLYPFIRNLPGLNRRVGKDNITNDADPKHMDKRLCTVACSIEGMVIKNICITRDLLQGWLERLPNHDWSEASIHNLLSPSDAQDVARAVKLLLCIVEISELDSADFDPSEAAEFEALCLLGEALDALLQPFINTELSLSEQIESLIKFGHLLCGLYTQNGTAFIPNQLYIDLQIMVKNAVLMVPKTYLLNPDLKVYICLLGDDVLEALFGRSRMIGGHSPNCSCGELRDRFGSAMTLDYIYEKHPELERKPRRLNMFRMRHVDHLRPAHFKRELRASSCIDLEARWKPAVKAAEAILAKYGVRMDMSFAERFRRPQTDLMRPMGGKYPAISGGVDRSMSNYSSDDASESIDLESIDFANLVAGVDFDAMIASEKLSSSSSSSPPATTHSLFAKIDTAGNQAHKKSILRTFFDMTLDSRGSHDRLQRTDCNETISDATHFQLGHLFTTLVAYNGTHIGLAVAKCTVIKRGSSGSKGSFPPAIPRAELNLPDSPFSISGQVLSLLPLPRNASAAWAWDGQFISFSLKKNKSLGDDVSRLQNLRVTVSSRLIDCAIHEQAQSVSGFDLPGDRDKTWSFQHSDLLSSWKLLWTTLLNDSSLHDKFPIFTAVTEGRFPYQVPSSPGFPGSVFALPITNTAIEHSIKSRMSCGVCQKPVKDQDRQSHVGEHVIKALRRVQDPSVKSAISCPYPCGTCGKDCKTGIKGGKADSDCPSAYPFLISAAKKYSSNRPCTNVPIYCAMADCKEVHWKYNFQRHLEERHPDWQRRISAQFAEQIHISLDEQISLHIPREMAIEWP